MSDKIIEQPKATHKVLCTHATFGTFHIYYMLCNIIKEMPDEMRLKIEVVGYEAHEDNSAFHSRIRYVEKSTVTKIDLKTCYHCNKKFDHKDGDNGIAVIYEKTKEEICLCSECDDNYFNCDKCGGDFYGKFHQQEETNDEGNNLIYCIECDSKS